MRRVESTLPPGERVVYEGHLSMWAMSPWLVLGIVLMVWGVLVGSLGDAVFSALLLFGGGLLMFGFAIALLLTTQLALTRKRLIATFGVFRPRRVMFELGEVRRVHVRQGPVGGIFDYGTLVIGRGGAPALRIAGIEKPFMFRERLARLRDALLAQMRMAA
ncbi:PH domain-containing protein [Paraburkholderia sp. Ac-20340]|uniref:PH domain-containing protein n=1 Tax=Paraburkholderia sp. Ac-20340 TaxID=2703888 RepID=UPI00197EDA35|nr:PH domain-containing protein [Paraburkholderia sp. Ac-20340]MBN3856070.1 PH domain-containing protein [Paraburkholderia sp. Ac-20340]